MSKLNDDFISRIQEDISKNPHYKMFVDQNNYLNEEAVQWVLFIMDYYIRFGGEPSVENIQLLFGMSEAKAKLTASTLKDMGLYPEN